MSNPEFPFHEQLTLQNFTAFSDQTMEFVPGLNVLVGENGTGKTHIMKALYAWQIARHLADRGGETDFARVFAETYGAKAVGELLRSKTRAANASGKFGTHSWEIGFQQSLAADNHNGVNQNVTRPVFIPAMELMAHARNMNGIVRQYADFDRTCYDFLAMVTAQPVASQLDMAQTNGAELDEIDGLKELVPGEVEWDESEQRFYLHERARRLPFSLIAEGYRKVSALYRLVQMGWLPPGGVLFWDEPEVNINPKWMDEVVQALVALARNGVQIFLATHSYVILKEINLVLRSQNGQYSEPLPVRFFGLRKERGVSKVTWADDFSAIEPNPILDQYDQMLMEDMRLQDLESGVR